MEVIVTGWRRGIGAEIVKRLEAQGDHALLFLGDIEDEDNWKQFTEIPFDALVNCAAKMCTADVVDESLDTFREVMDSNLIGPWLGMRYAIKRFMAQGHGNVVNITSIYADDSGVGLASAYHASKAALSMLTRNAAVRYGKHGIRVNEVRPGFTRTRMTAKYDTSDTYKDYVDKGTPLKRMANPREIVEAVLFLLSDKASFITGASLAVDGGWTA